MRRLQDSLTPPRRCLKAAGIITSRIELGTQVSAEALRSAGPQQQRVLHAVELQFLITILSIPRSLKNLTILSTKLLIVRRN